MENILQICSDSPAWRWSHGLQKEEKIKRYEAEFEYAGAQYEIKGVVEKEEFEKILKNLYFSK